MPSHKLEITKKFGTYRARFGPMGDLGDESEFDTFEDVVEFVRDSATSLTLGGDDNVIFRGISYTSVQELLNEVRNGNY